jgi:hypothetical protein
VVVVALAEVMEQVADLAAVEHTIPQVELVLLVHLDKVMMVEPVTVAVHSRLEVVAEPHQLEFPVLQVV